MKRIFLDTNILIDYIDTGQVLTMQSRFSLVDSLAKHCCLPLR